MSPRFQNLSRTQLLEHDVGPPEIVVFFLFLMLLKDVFGLGFVYFWSFEIAMFLVFGSKTPAPPVFCRSWGAFFNVYLLKASKKHPLEGPGLK